MRKDTYLSVRREEYPSFQNWEFLDTLLKEKVPVNYDEELKKDIKIIDQL